MNEGTKERNRPEIFMSDETKPYRPRCLYLTCKAMMVYGDDFENDPEYQAGAVDITCTCTATLLGPDGGNAGLEACSNPERTCFREF
jgi:hypothetical protein